MRSLHDRQHHGPFAAVETDWRRWMYVQVDPLVPDDTRARCEARAEALAADRASYYPWLMLAGRALRILATRIPDGDRWRHLAHHGPDALVAYRWEQRLIDDGRFSPDMAGVEVFPHPDHAAAHILTTLLTGGCRDGWLAEADVAWSTVTDVFHILVALVAYHDPGLDLRWWMTTVARLTLDGT